MKIVSFQEMANEYELYLEASTRGYHAYFKDATFYIGEILFCELEPDNQHSKYAVVVKNEDNSIVHVGISGPKIFHSCRLINISGGRPKGLVGSIMSAVLSRKIASKQKKWRPKAVKNS